MGSVSSVRPRTPFTRPGLRRVRGGVGLAGGRLTAADVRCAFYGNLFPPAGRHLAGGDPLIRAEDLDQFEQDLLAAWWGEAARTDAAVVAPDARTLAGGRRVACSARCGH